MTVKLSFFHAMKKCFQTSVDGYSRYGLKADFPSQNERVAYTIFFETETSQRASGVLF